MDANGHYRRGVTRALEAPPQSGRRAAIVEAAVRLFAENGYRATTMEDIGRALNLRGPSLYRHVSSKQELLAEIMVAHMAALQRDHGIAVASSDDVAEQLRRAVEAHVRYHARHRLEALLGNRELRNLDEANHRRLLEQRKEYELGFRGLVERGIAEGRFAARSVKLAVYSLLDMGAGVSVWFREDGEFSVDEVAYRYGDMAMLLLRTR
jgi:AcrR family transcriptional regulator